MANAENPRCPEFNRLPHTPSCCGNYGLPRHEAMPQCSQDNEILARADRPDAG